MDAVSSPRMDTRANRASSARVCWSSSSDNRRTLVARLVMMIEVVRKAANATKSSCCSTRKLNIGGLKKKTRHPTAATESMTEVKYLPSVDITTTQTNSKNPAVAKSHPNNKQA